MPRIAIIGLGLIGGSLGLALKRAELEGLEIVGYDAERGVGGRARKLGAIDQDARHPADAVKEAALVVIATPILQVKKVLEEIAPALGEGAVVTDTASTKREVMRWAEDLLPNGVSFVGGHPIAGKEQPGLDAADASLFQERTWAVTPSVHATDQAVKTVENFITLVGARPIIVNAEEHDSYLAAVSHLPLLASIALFTLASGSQAWPDLAALSGPGFRDATRLASSSPDLSHDITLTNRENLLHWLDRYGEELQRFRDLIADGEAEEELFKELAKAQAMRDAFLQAPPEHPSSKQDVESINAGERMLAFMVGDYVIRRTKELNEIMDRRAENDEDLRRKPKGR